MKKYYKFKELSKLYAINIYFCYGEKQYKKLCKDKNIEIEEYNTPGSGMTVLIENENINCIIIYICDCKYCRKDLYNLIPHESYHAMEYIKEFIGDENNGDLSAYLLGYITKKIFKKTLK